MDSGLVWVGAQRLGRASEALGMPRRVLRRAAARGDLRAVRLGRLWWVSDRALALWLSSLV